MITRMVHALVLGHWLMERHRGVKCSCGKTWYFR